MPRILHLSDFDIYILKLQNHPFNLNQQQYRISRKSYDTITRKDKLINDRQSGLLSFPYKLDLIP